MLSPILTIWLRWLCQCGDINIQAHPYIRVKVNISAWIGYWLCIHTATSDHHHPQIVWTGAGKCLDESSAKPTSRDNLISVTLPMWWYQRPGTSIHQSQSQHQCMNRLLAASIPPHWIVTVLNWWLMIAVVELYLWGAKIMSCYNMISVTLPMWWYQHLGTSIHQSQSQHQCMNRLLAASIPPHWIITVLKLCGLVQVNVLMNHLPSPPVVTIWFQWLCQCGDINVQAHPYIRVKVDISAWIGYWLHPYHHIGLSLSSIGDSWLLL